MLILGIETSCDETAASLLEVKDNKIKVLSNVISSQVKLHAKYGGVFPSLAAREHIKNLPKVLKSGLGKTKIENVDLIAVTRGPGLVSSLLVGTAFAQTLAWKYKKPIIGTNHLKGHIASNWLKPTGVDSELKVTSSELFPSMCLIVSGGHTELVLMKNFGSYKTVGQTLDDAAGEAFDKIARILGLGYPGGPAIAREAENRNQKIENRIKLPRPMINSKNFDFSFSGLKTAVLYLVRDLTKTYPLSKTRAHKTYVLGRALSKLSALVKTAIAAEAQQAIIDTLVSKTTKAAEKYKAKSIMLSGGVSANKLLRLELEREAVKKNIVFLKPEMEYTTDNAAMIALAGYFAFLEKRKTDWPSHLKRCEGWKSVSVDANLGF